MHPVKISSMSFLFLTLAYYNNSNFLLKEKLMRNPKTDYIENHIGAIDGEKGKKVKASMSEVRPEVETPEFQEAIIVKKESTVITLDDGTEFELPDELTLDQVIRKRLNIAMRSFWSLANHWGVVYSGEVYQVGAVCTDTSFLILSLQCATVISEAERFMSTFFGKPQNIFKDKLDQVSTINLYGWVIKQLTKEVNKNQKN
jgi:hypothetical protein